MDKKPITVSPNNSDWSREVYRAFYSYLPTANIAEVSLKWMVKDGENGDAVLLFTKGTDVYSVPVVIRRRQLKPLDMVLTPQGVKEYLSPEFMDRLESGGQIGRVISKQEAKVNTRSIQGVSNGSSSDISGSYLKMASACGMTEPEIRSMVSRVKSPTSNFSKVASYYPEFTGVFDKLAEAALIGAHNKTRSSKMEKLASESEVCSGDPSSGYCFWTFTGEKVAELDAKDARGIERILYQNGFSKFGGNGTVDNPNVFSKKAEQYYVSDHMNRIHAHQNVPVTRPTITKTAERITKKKASSLQPGDVVRLPKGLVKIATSFVVDKSWEGSGMFTSDEMPVAVPKRLVSSSLLKEAYDLGNRVLIPGYVDVISSVETQEPQEFCKLDKTAEHGSFKEIPITCVGTGKYRVGDSNQFSSLEHIQNMCKVAGISPDHIEKILVSTGPMYLNIKTASAQEPIKIVRGLDVPLDTLIKIAIDTATGAFSPLAGPTEAYLPIMALFTQKIDADNLPLLYSDMYDFYQLLLDVYLAAKKEEIPTQDTDIQPVVERCSTFLYRIMSDSQIHSKGQEKQTTAKNNPTPVSQ
jgi:hypothetical protein